MRNLRIALSNALTSQLNTMTIKGVRHPTESLIALPCGQKLTNTKGEKMNTEQLKKIHLELVASLTNSERQALKLMNKQLQPLVDLVKLYSDKTELTNAILNRSISAILLVKAGK